MRFGGARPPPADAGFHGFAVERLPRRRMLAGNVLSNQAIERYERRRVVLYKVGANRHPRWVIGVVLDDDVSSHADEGNAVSFLMEVNARPL